MKQKESGAGSSEMIGKKTRVEKVGKKSFLQALNVAAARSTNSKSAMIDYMAQIKHQMWRSVTTVYKRLPLCDSLFTTKSQIDTLNEEEDDGQFRSSGKEEKGFSQWYFTHFILTITCYWIVEMIY